MPDVLVRDLDEIVVEKLKKNVAGRGRSLQSELKEILEEAARRQDILSAAESAQRIRDSLRGRFHSDSVELIREDRSR